MTRRQGISANPKTGKKCPQIHQIKGKRQSTVIVSANLAVI